jgi:hypothetical protein
MYKFEEYRRFAAALPGNGTHNAFPDNPGTRLPY